MSTLMQMMKQTTFEIPELAGHYEKRIFVGGNYDDMPSLRKIVNSIREVDYEPILAFDIKDVPKDKIHDFDITLLRLCKYALFEVSTGNGHMMEIEAAVKCFGTVTFGVYKVRSAKHRKAPPTVTTMLTTLNVPMFAYHDDNRLGEILKMIFPMIKDDPKSAWCNIIKKSQFPPLFKSWFCTSIDYLMQFV
jgi:hypothetical protein